MKQLGVGGGMTSRTVFVYAGRKGKHIPATKMKAFDVELRGNLIMDLSAIKEMAGTFDMTDEADTVYTEWYGWEEKKRRGRYQETSVDDARFASYWERLPSMVLKVAMIVSASRREDMKIVGTDIIQSIKMFEHIHPDMPQAFGGMGQNVLGSQTEMLRNLLRDKGRVSRSYVMHTLRMHINEWDYKRCRDHLLAERFCVRLWSQEDGEEILILQDSHKKEAETDITTQTV
jgi:hypothetical protein